ncbi:MAG: FprA family A-type flavoprotein, partial [Eubacteriales bacterium]|nr:FprA family A-type flavoprotein [Eubacteriales bacterium]
MFIHEDVKFVGVNDHAVDLFEGQYVVPNGISYNSYVILDEKIAVLDTVDQNFIPEWLDKIVAVLGDKTPDYLVVHHMEPDHAAGIHAFLRKFPEAVVISSAKAFVIMKQFFGSDYADRRMVVKEGDVVSFGKHALAFVEAPMVHWPEVLVSYDPATKILFAADGFGKFGALDVEEPWDDEARRYFIGIVGKFGKNVQALLKKAATLDIQTICPLHGPVLTENLGHYLSLYDTWSAYRPEEEGIVIAYTSVYGHTKDAVTLFAELLREKTEKPVVVYDLARCDMAQVVADAFRYSTLVLATTTYNGKIFPFMRELICDLNEHAYQNRKVALIENGCWAPTAAKVMRDSLQGANLSFAETVVTIRSALQDDSKAQL